MACRGVGREGPPSQVEGEDVADAALRRCGRRGAFGYVREWDEGVRMLYDPGGAESRSGGGVGRVVGGTLCAQCQQDGRCHGWVGAVRRGRNAVEEASHEDVGAGGRVWEAHAGAQCWDWGFLKAPSEQLPAEVQALLVEPGVVYRAEVGGAEGVVAVAQNHG